jgi:hypothetical protein
MGKLGSQYRLGDMGGRQTRLMLVFSLDLENVEEIGSRGMDLDEILIRGGLGIRELSDLELVRPLL